MSLAFVPRKVGKRPPSTSVSKVNSDGNSNGKRVALSHTLQLDVAAGVAATSSGSTRPDETSVSAEDLAILIVLTLTEYGLWTNADLRRRLNEEEFFSLRHVLKHSPLIQEHYSQELPSESSIVKALRKHAEAEIDVRMVLSGPTWSKWGSSSRASSSGHTDEGMYEIRLKRRKYIDAMGNEVYTREHWAKRTAYIENIPPVHRTLPATYRFIQCICRHSTSNPLEITIQHISFPSHYLDAEDHSGLQKAPQKGKGFAFVTFSSPEEVAHLSTIWDWERSYRTPEYGEDPSSHTSTEAVPSTEFLSVSEPLTKAKPITEAFKYGFRALPKVKWNALKDEYVAWRKTLLDDVFAAQENNNGQAPDDEQAEETLESEFAAFEPVTGAGIEDSPTATLTSSSPFPPGCLVFIRNIHPGTNKSTLRTFFSKTLTPAHGASLDTAIDYIDYTKGTDTCYLRLASPSYARSLVSYFCDNCHLRRITQRNALDDTGTEADSEAGNPLQAELVQGKREEIYWEKVPDKVKREAVQKALSDINASSSTSSTKLSAASPPIAEVSLSSPYPPDCLLFVRNVHSGTNKTTLRTLFAKVLSSRSEAAATGTGIVDYVDYTKGTDACHLRLATPSDARFLEKCLREKQLVQTGPLDDGVEISSGMSNAQGNSDALRPIIVELVQGTREKIYWEKVPLKVRQEAVRRAASAASAVMITAVSHGTGARTVSSPEALKVSKKRKRAGVEAAKTEDVGGNIEAGIREEDSALLSVKEDSRRRK